MNIICQDTLALVKFKAKTALVQFLVDQGEKRIKISPHRGQHERAPYTIKQFTQQPCLRKQFDGVWHGLSCCTTVWNNSVEFEIYWALDARLKRSLNVYGSVNSLGQIQVSSCLIAVQFRSSVFHCEYYTSARMYMVYPGCLATARVQGDSRGTTSLPCTCTTLY